MWSDSSSFLLNANSGAANTVACKCRNCHYVQQDVSFVSFSSTPFFSAHSYFYSCVSDLISSAGTGRTPRALTVRYVAQRLHKADSYLFEGSIALEITCSGVMQVVAGEWNRSEFHLIESISNPSINRLNGSLKWCGISVCWQRSDESLREDLALHSVHHNCP